WSPVDEEDRPPVRGSVEDDRRPEPREIAGSLRAALEEQVRVLGARDEKATSFGDVLKKEEVGEGMDHTQPTFASDSPESGRVDVGAAPGEPDLPGAPVPAQSDTALEERSQGPLPRPIDRSDPHFPGIVGAGRVMDEGDFLLVRRDRHPRNRPRGPKKNALELAGGVPNLENSRRAIFLDDGREVPPLCPIRPAGILEKRPRLAAEGRPPGERPERVDGGSGTT